MPSFLQTFIMTNWFISTVRKSSNKCLCDSPQFQNQNSPKVKQQNTFYKQQIVLVTMDPRFCVFRLPSRSISLCYVNSQEWFSANHTSRNSTRNLSTAQIIVGLHIAYQFISMLIGCKQDLARLSFHTERSTSVWFGSALESANRKCRIRMVQILQLSQGVTLAMEVNGRRKELFRV